MDGPRGLGLTSRWKKRPSNGSPAWIRTVIHGDGSITPIRRKLCRFTAQTGLFERLPTPLMRAERSELLRFRGVDHSSNNWLVPDWIRTLIHVDRLPPQPSRVRFMRFRC